MSSERKSIYEMTHATVDVNFVTLGDLQKQCNGLIETYGKDALVRMDYADAYSSTKYPYVFQKRLENDEEYNKRVAIETERTRLIADHEMSEYQRLKKKFESNKE